VHTTPSTQCVGFRLNGSKTVDTICDVVHPGPHTSSPWPVILAGLVIVSTIALLAWWINRRKRPAQSEPLAPDSN
jgi:hypothetical protein